MNEVYSFIQETNKVTFLKSQSIVFNHPDYNPYSDDLERMEKLLDGNKDLDVVNYDNINIMLSPQAHIIKCHAFIKMGNEEDAGLEMVKADKILLGISLTGNGTLEFPYIVTRISDEKDFLSYANEQPKMQKLIHYNGKKIDVIDCISGNKVHFDISVPYKKMDNLLDSDYFSLSPETDLPKKWWQFWK